MTLFGNLVGMGLSHSLNTGILTFAVGTCIQILLPFINRFLTNSPKKVFKQT